MSWFSYITKYNVIEVKKNRLNWKLWFEAQLIFFNKSIRNYRLYKYLFMYIQIINYIIFFIKKNFRYNKSVYTVSLLSDYTEQK